MQTPYSSPASIDAQATGERRPLWKAFWLVFVPSYVAANTLSLMGLMFWKHQAPDTLLRSLSTVLALSPSWLLWLTVAVPFVLATAVGLRAVWRAAPARRFTALTWIARLITVANAAWVVSILVRAYLRAFRDVL